MLIKEKIKSFWKNFSQILNSITERQLLTTAIVLVILGSVVVFLSYPHYKSNDNYFYVNLLSEAHGMIFDILIIGMLLVWLNKIGEKRIRIKRHQEEIDDFRHWINEEASFRIAGDIKRLNKDGVHNIELFNCNLKNVNLNYIILTGSNLNNIHLDDSTMQNSDLRNIRANQASFMNVKLQKANLSGSQLSGANFKFTTLIKANITNSNLIKTKFTGAVMIDCVLTGSMVAGADFTDANLFKADLTGCKGLTLEQLSKCRNIHQAKLDAGMEEKLKEFAPHLFTEEAQAFSITPNTPK
ncbi:MAG: pentapeptide repeat-containing protein [Cytophagales bacterium]|nr:MAG: pentapeptide repeat-containing protein [Cytophagales bacterium]